MSSDPIEVLRELVQRWRKEESRHEEGMNSVDPAVSNYHEGMSQAFGECADELDTALASLSAPKPESAPQPPAETQRCTCPSGDGSLRWPCPAHPADADTAPPRPEASAPVGVEDHDVASPGEDPKPPHTPALRWLADREAVATQEWQDGFNAAYSYYAQQPSVAPVGVSPPSGVAWHPIETAPKDNKHPLYLARFNPDTGELIELDWDASWEAESESWEMPQMYYIWRSANDRVEEPTHWAYQNISAQRPAAAAPVGVEVKVLARDVHYAIRDAGLAPESPADDAAMRDAILRTLAQQPAADFDTWQQNPYTKVLMKSIAEDYVPKHDQQPAAVDGAAPLTERQAVIVTGYTGVLCSSFDAFHADLEKRAGRPVLTHEMADFGWIKPLYRDDFLGLAGQQQGETP